MRVFFGLELDAATTLTIADWRDRQLACSGRPVPAANFHITLAFVGQADNHGMERLCLAVDDWLARGTSCSGELLLDGVGYWPKPGIYWLGCRDWPQQLSTLANKLKTLGLNAGGKRDRNTFQPHVTLFRSCLEAPPAPPFTPSITLAYSHFSLFESRQGKQGVSYHSLQDWPLPAATS